jgi:hypothetical protein
MLAQDWIGVGKYRFMHSISYSLLATRSGGRKETGERQELYTAGTFGSRGWRWTVENLKDKQYDLN